MLNKFVRRALGCASLLAIATGAPAQAQQIDRIIAFGDSYADTGNFFRLVGIDPLTTQVYTTGRFSGGSNYVDTLSDILHVPQYNFAIGGAHADNNNQTPGVPGLTFEVAQFNAGGGALGFPVVDTTLTRSDLVLVSIGANDARGYQQGGGTVAGAATAAASAVTSTQQNLDVVMAHGTPTLSYLALNGAIAPEVANDPAAQQVRAAFSNAYFSGLQPVLAGYAANGSIVHYLDGSLILQDVQANPSAYGITNGLVCPIFPDPTCVVNSNGYLFYGDALHLTSQGFAIVAHYIAVQLAAPLTLQAPSDLGLDTAQQWGRTLSSRADLYGSHSKPGLHLFIVGDAFSRKVAQSSQNSAFDIKGAGGTVGAEYGFGTSALVGVAGNYSRPEVRFGNESARINGRTWQIGAYGSFTSGGLFGQAYLGYGKDRNDLTRTGVVDSMKANPHGNHVIAGAKGGYLMSLAGLQLGPIAELDYSRASVNGYTESGDPALTLNVSGQHAKSLSGQAGLEARGDLAGLHPFVDLTAEHVFSANDRTINFSQTSAPIIVNSWDVSGKKETYGRLTTGAAADITGRLSLDLEISTTLGRNGGQQLGGQLGLKARF